MSNGTLVVGDSHGTLPMIREAARAAQQLGVARIVSVGDFGIWPGSSGKQFLDQIQRIAEARDVDVYVVPGNHDDYDQIAVAEADDDGWLVFRDRIRAAPRGHIWTWEGLTWLGFGGAASIDGPGGPEDFPQDRGPLDKPTERRDRRGELCTRPAGYDLGSWWEAERITQEDVDRTTAEIGTFEAAGGEIDVLISHDAPMVLGLTGEHHKPIGWPLGLEQRELLQAVWDAAQPTIHVGGHWHKFHRDVVDGKFVSTLAADVTPSEIQWVLVRDGESGPEVAACVPWSETFALTAPPDGKGRVNRRHQIVSDLTARDLRVLYP